MNRREVLTGLTTLVVVPVLPSPVVRLITPATVELVRTDLVTKIFLHGMDGVYTEGITYEVV